MSFLSKAIISLRPGAQFSTNGDTIIWHDTEQTQPSDLEIAEKEAELQAEFDAQEYARNRKAEYPTTDELVVALWEAVIEERMASSIDLQGKRTAIKEKYPK
mgnify:FL=1|tara:strand:- start:2028 stop:2333 length:306 start_codon:yes stop_codon:yes gene_type:complete